MWSLRAACLARRGAITRARNGAKKNLEAGWTRRKKVRVEDDKNLGATRVWNVGDCSNVLIAAALSEITGMGDEAC